MAATLSARARLLGDTDFLRRIQVAIVNAAVNVAAESPETPNHAQRVTLAGQVLRSPEPWSEVFAGGVVASDNIGLGGSDDPSIHDDGDGALQFVINSLWDAYALSGR